MEPTSDIGLIGLAVMGQNLVLNIVDHNYNISVFNRTTAKTLEFIKENPSKKILGLEELSEFVSSLKRPRKIILMVKSGPAVDTFIEKLLPLLDKDDIIIDGGNSHFDDTERRYHECKDKNISFIGCGISGGEEGARHGPSMMPGGDIKAWPHIKPIFQDIAAKHNDKSCCEWVGPGGAGHFVKMVHNGIEYADMQLICEAYNIAKDIHKLDNTQISQLFNHWNEGRLQSYLIEITGLIFQKLDSDQSTYLIDKILDVAGQKGTGRWTAISSLNEGIALPTITESVFCRALSSKKQLRENIESLYTIKTTEPTNCSLDDLEAALYCSKVISYAQGFDLIQSKSEAMNWNINMASIAALWTEGCIIRCQFLKEIIQTYDQNPSLPHLLMAKPFRNAIESSFLSWTKMISIGILNGLPCSCLSSALNYFNSIRRGSLPTNLIQAQRDFFGAHTYERVDKARGEYFHTQWL